MILVLVTVIVGTFSVFGVVWVRTMFPPNEAQFGASIVHFDVYLVMRRPFWVVRGFAVSGRAGRFR